MSQVIEEINSDNLARNLHRQYPAFGNAVNMPQLFTNKPVLYT
jgi:hypothetical protein